MRALKEEMHVIIVWLFWHFLDVTWKFQGVFILFEIRGIWNLRCYNISSRWLSWKTLSPCRHITVPFFSFKSRYAFFEIIALPFFCILLKNLKWNTWEYAKSFYNIKLKVCSFWCVRKHLEVNFCDMHLQCDNHT